MSMSENLIEKRSALLAEAQELVSLAEAEGRDLTADEDEKVAASLRSAADLDPTIKMHQDLEARSREAAELRRADPDDRGDCRQYGHDGASKREVPGAASPYIQHS